MMTEEDRRARRDFFEAFARWAASPDARQYHGADPRELFRAAYLAGRIDGELEALGLERDDLLKIRACPPTDEEIIAPVPMPVFHKGIRCRRRTGR